MSSFCVIRKYKEGDEHTIKEIISESVMEQVNSYFWNACLSELFPQIAVACVAISYIFLGIPLKYALIFVPGSVIFIYLVVYFGHFIKTNELNSDLDNIPNNYMKDIGTTFLVAEYHGKVGEAELSSLMNKPKKFEYDFYTEREFQLGNVNARGLSKIVVGCVAITRSMRNSERLADPGLCVVVTLFGSAYAFLTAKQMYWNEGFVNSESINKAFLGFGGNLLSFKMYRPLNKPETIEEATESQNETEQQNDLIDL
ncbi:hypothetical protein Anas_04254 [Armadillidium nasatum]|uniref:Uncharacterized protein n=1 Tax=Armadillidium nasatum TaxID=96803 RepID=A0A5N5SY47_9CRUS|nr:hypothetical protein Anas_04254 [Armadillidium nasatum]